MDKRDYPIQIVEVQRKDYRAPGQIAPTNKHFGDISTSMRRSLCQQVTAVRDRFSEQFGRWPSLPAIAKVTLKDEALAKSHRPTALFTKTTCPIVGTLDYGELLVSATAQGLESLSNRILSTSARRPIANITAIESIEAYSLNDWPAAQLEKALKNWVKGGQHLKFHLFDHKDDEVNEQLRLALVQLAEQLGIQLSEKTYGERVKFFAVETGSTETIAQKELGKFLGLRSVAPMPNYRPADLNVMTQPVGVVDDSMIPPPADDEAYPIVGIIDSGVCPDCTLLQPWVEGTEQYVPPELQDNTHGTMVAGLVTSSFRLNHEDERFPKTQAKIVDVQVFEKGKPISEDTLVSIIEEVLENHPKVNVWNLSLGGDDPANTSEFSDFATFLDEMHDKYGCLFVVASGNHDLLQKWPCTNDNGGADRVSSPGDSIRGLTVGSIANDHKEKSLSKTEEPSPFSRRGPGPCHIPKPEVTHYGGNCTASKTYAQTGILSAGPNNTLVESIGTSFSTPLVSSQAAAIWHYLEESEGACTPERVKALVVHSALIGEYGLSKETLNYTGFGKPGDAIDALYCDPTSITFLFEVDLRYGGYEFERWPIPMVDGLKNDDGKFKGEIDMTLVYSPIVDKDFASEYCRTNVDVGMGKYDKTVSKDGGESYEFNSIVPLAPKDVKDLYEKSQIEHGFKWSPVKAYHAVFPRGKNVETWRLKMKATKRAELPLPSQPQPATLLVTLRSYGPETEVYNEMMRLIASAGWVTTPIDSHIQVKLEQ